MSFELVFVLIVLVLTTALFVTELLPFDLTAILALAAVSLAGIVTPEEALSGLSNTATVTIACMLIISYALEETGVIGRIASSLERLSRSTAPPLVVLMLLVGVAVGSGFMNNTAVVAVFIPVVVRLAPRLGIGASKLLMPLSFVAIFGGVCTLIGTSTNLLVSSVARDHGLAPIGMFELTPVGIVLLVAGLVYLSTVGRPLLPDGRETGDLTTSFDLDACLTEVVIENPQALRGSGRSPVDQARAEDLTSDLDLDLLEVIRDGQALKATPEVWQRGDRARLRGSPNAIAHLTARAGVRVALTPAVDEPGLGSGERVVVEVVLAPDTALEGATIRSLGFKERFGAIVLAIRVHGEPQVTELDEIRLRGGQSLLLLVDRERVEALSEEGLFVVVSKVEAKVWRRRRGPLAIAILAAVVGTAALGLLPIVVSAVAGVALLVLARCIRLEDAYHRLSWNVIILLAGLMPLGIAMESSGAASLVSSGAVSVLEPMGPVALVAGFLILTLVLTNVMSNIAAAALLAPVAIEAAAAASVSARPLLMAVTFGASLSFVSPIGYQTNTLVYGPGAYRFTDFLRVGTPLTAISCVICVLMIPWLWPL